MKLSLLLTWTLLFAGILWGKPFQIIAPSDPRITTHQLHSGDFIIGLTDNGGGVINQVYIPGLGDIMDKATDMYGRAGQVAIRDDSHGGRYNPTQAGFWETLGTQCEIIEEENKLIVQPRGMALWHGDRKYDFAEWENIGPDPYQNDGGHGDLDGLDESDLPGKQASEVYSEFDYYGVYENVLGRNGITTPAVYHYFEIRFIRPPGHCLNQFRVGTPLWRPEAVRDDISVESPAGIFPGTDKDLNGMVAVWSLRHDKKKWEYKYVYFRRPDGTWAVEESQGPVVKRMREESDATAFILADSSTPSEGIALGLFRPETDVNLNTIVGINESSGRIVYKDNRTEQMSPLFNLSRTPIMTKYGFFGKFTGMINRTRLPANVYEAFRSEFYILQGTPGEIMKAINLLENQ